MSNPGVPDGTGELHDRTGGYQTAEYTAVKLIQVQTPVTPASPAEPPDIEWARRYMLKECGPGTFFGAAEIEHAFPGLRIDRTRVPAAPHAEEIKRHAALGHSLYLRIPAGADGVPLTAERMEHLVWHRWAYDDPSQGGVHFMKHGYPLSTRGTDERAEPYFSAEASRSGWAFASDGLLEGTDKMSFNDQTDAVAAFAKKHLSPDTHPDIQAALREYDAEAHLRTWGGFTRMTIGMLLQASAAETFYDALVKFANTKRNRKPVRLLESRATWTSSTERGGLPVMAGIFDEGGMRMAGIETRFQNWRMSLGIRISRLFPARSEVY